MESVKQLYHDFTDKALFVDETVIDNIIPAIEKAVRRGQSDLVVA